VHPTNHPTFNKLPRFLCLLMILFLAKGVNAQGEWNNWYFGEYVGLNFQSNPPAILLDGGLGAEGGTAVISDSSGQLLFYSNGYSIFNRNHTLMLNGGGLYGGSGLFMHCVYTTPFIEDTNKYYVFTIALNPFAGIYGLFYTVVDMRLDNGLGGVVTGQKNIPVPGGNIVKSVIFGIRHTNKRNFWLITQEYVSTNVNRYLVFLVDKNGIHPPVISNSSVLVAEASGNSHFAISQSGTKLIGQYGKKILENCSFNASTGVVTPLFTFSFPEPAGLELTLCFSWSGNKLYVSQWASGLPPYKYYLYQLDASLTDSAAFAESLVQVSKCNYFGVLALGKDAKIYMTERNDDGFMHHNDSISVIRNPELPGKFCNFEESAMSLQGRECRDGLPRFLQRYFAYINHAGYCQGMPVTFEPNTWPPPDSLWWDFGDPASGTANFSNDSTPEHIFSSAGTFTVQMIVRHIDMRYDTATVNITIEPQPSPNLGPDRTVCENQTVILDAGFNPQWTYLWSTGATTSSIAVSNSGTYGVTVTSPNGCTGSDTVVLSILPGSTPLPKQIRHN